MAAVEQDEMIVCMICYRTEVVAATVVVVPEQQEPAQVHLTCYGCSKEEGEKKNCRNCNMLHCLDCMNTETWLCTICNACFGDQGMAVPVWYVIGQ